MNDTILDVDARGQEPPQPMIQILEALEKLQGGTRGLRARTDRRPVHLYPLLAQRGFEGETTADPAAGGYVTIIRRRG